MKKFLLLVTVAICFCSCTSNNPEAALKKALKAENGIDFKITNIEAIGSCTFEELLEDRIERTERSLSYFQTANGLFSAITPTEESAHTKERLESLLQGFNDIKAKLANNLDDVAYTDYLFSAVPADGSTILEYDNVYCSISSSATKNKVLGIGTKLKTIHKYDVYALPGYDQIANPAQDEEKKEQ